MRAWLRLDALGLSLPVCQASRESPGWYLAHDPFGRASVAGTPFMDFRCDARSRQVLVFGHRLAGTDAVFTKLAPCWRQEEFDKVCGCELVWATLGERERLRPLCALRLHESDQDIQAFDAAGPEELRRWLHRQCVRADARAGGWEEIVGGARRSIGLVTCNASVSGMPWRTVVLFVGAQEPKGES